MRHDPAVAATRSAVRHALEGATLATGDLVLAAVSGGADSLALASALAREAPKKRLRAGAVVVDHALQSGSASVAAAAAASCQVMGLAPVVVERVDVGTSGGPEAAARTARYDVLRRVAAETGAAAVLTGHTLDDQAESVLLALARGSGSRSLAGIPPVSHLGDGLLLRPLLGVRRTETEAACAALGLEPWRDPHNDDDAFTRVRVRRDAMPALESALGPGVAEALARTAALLRADTEALDEWADAAAADGLSVQALAALPPAVRRRVLRRAVVTAGAPAGSLTAGHVAEVDRLVVDWHGQRGVSLPGGLVAERRYDRLSFR